MLLAAVMPNVLYIGHGPTAPSHSHSAEAPARDEGTDEHVQHCHVGAAKCAGPQSLVGTWSVGEGLLIPQPPLLRVVQESEYVAAIESEPSLFLRPPQATV